LNEANRRLLYNLFINDRINYRQSVSTFITDNQTLIDHIYTNLAESQAKCWKHFSDHKAVYTLINCFHLIKAK
jgi:hypothetical protein